MRRVLFPIALALAAAVPASQRVAACGDKFLHTGGGLFQNVYAPAHSASVLVFAPARSSGAPLLKNQKFQSALSRVGHKVVIVLDEGGLSQALKAGSTYDLALVGLDDLQAFERAEGAAKQAVTILAVQNKPTKAAVEACRLQLYDCHLKTSDRLDEYLQTIDNKMDAKKKAAAGKKK